VRVTNQMMGNALKQHIQNNLSKLSRTQEQISTGKTILRPSDNPTDISRLMAVKAQREINKQYTQNIDDGLTYLYTTDTALGTLGDIMAQANELAVQGANGHLEKSDMQALGEQVDKLIDQVVDIANTTAGGKYIFAGRRNAHPPFERKEGTDIITYHGDDLPIKREIANGANYAVHAPGVAVTTGDTAHNDVPGDSGDIPGIFGFINKVVDDPTGATVSDGTPDENNLPESTEKMGLFDTLFKLRNLLNDGEASEVSDFIGEIQNQLDHVLENRVGIGARTRHFEAVKEQMLGQEIRLSQVMQDIQSADIARLSIDLAQQQLTYQTTLSAGANMLQTSLLNFLR